MNLKGDRKSRGATIARLWRASLCQRQRHRNRSLWGGRWDPDCNRSLIWAHSRCPTLDRSYWTSSRSLLWRTKFEKTCMAHGVVNLSCEATISLVVSKTNRRTQLISAVIFAVFSGSRQPEKRWAISFPRCESNKSRVGSSSSVSPATSAIESVTQILRATDSSTLIET